MWLLNAANIGVTPALLSTEGSMIQSNQLAIETLILERSEALGLKRSDLVLRAGFKNVAKGLRRLDQLCAGELKATASLIAGLPVALELPPEVIADAVRQTAQQVAGAERIAEQEAEAAWRASFEPCAYFVGTAEKPSSICIYGISGGAERWLKIPINISKPPVTFAAQALNLVRETSSVSFWGRTTGFIVNYTPDFAVRFDINGIPVEVLDHAYRPAEVTLQIGGKEIPAESLLGLRSTSAPDYS